MIVSLIDFALPEKLTSGDIIGAGHLGGGWSLSHSPNPKLTSDDIIGAGHLGGGWRLPRIPGLNNSKNDRAPFRIAADNTDVVKAIRVEVQREFKWLRLEIDIPATELAMSIYKYSLQYKCLGPEAESGPQVKILEYQNGIGETFHMISRNLARSGSIRSIENAIDVAQAGLQDASYRFCIEFRKPITFWLYDIELLRLEGGKKNDYNEQNAGRFVAPFRAHGFQVSAALKELNNNMDTMMHTSPLKWVRDMLKVALTLEDYDKARGLVRYLERNYGDDPALLGMVGDLILNTKIAIGETEGAQNFITRFNASKRPSDNSIIVARTLQVRSKPHPQYDLPSGKSDIFNLSKDILSHRDVEFEALLRNAPEGSEHHLLWANYFLHRSEAEYLKQINYYLKAVNIPFEIGLTDYQDNILARVEFNATQPLDLPSEGPLVSVILAAYNAATTIKYAINSILNQSYGNIELLVCDDGSDDDTKLVLQTFTGDPRVRIFESSANQGPYNIRNWMLSKAHGEIITFHDADDVALPHRVAAQLQQMIIDKNTVVMSQWIRMRENGHLVAFKDGTYRRNCLNSIMFTRAVFEEYGPYREVVCAADSEFYEMLRGKMTQKGISIIPQPLVLGLWGANSLTRTSGLEADELGFRAASRRSYIAMAARQRVLGKHIVTDKMVLGAAKKAGIYREPQAVTELTESKD